MTTWFVWDFTVSRPAHSRRMLVRFERRSRTEGAQPGAPCRAADAAVRNLVVGNHSVMITLLNGAPRRVALADCVDPVSGKGLRRTVDVQSEDYRAARRYMVRLEKSDFAHEVRISELAAAGGMTPQQLRDYFTRPSTSD